MKTSQVVLGLAAMIAGISLPIQAGTLSDHFSASTLGAEWKGDREAFRIVNSELDGVSASPLAPSPFELVEIEADSSDCSVGVWMNVVMPNLRVCTKGAIVARHAGTGGYVFALHEATQTAEIYRLHNQEILLNKPWKIDLGKWYYIRLELHGPVMDFFIDDKLVGSITDSASPSGAVGLAVQDAESVLFDDFTISGPGIVGNVDNLPKPQFSPLALSSDAVVIRFLAEPPYDYFVQVSSSIEPSHNWQTIATVRAKIETFQATVTDAKSPGPRFYRIEKVPCYCR